MFTLWDARNLYLTFDVRSTKLQASVLERDGDKLWMDDGVEVLVDPGRQEFLPDDFAYHTNILLPFVMIAERPRAGRIRRGTVWRNTP